jgi:hypothetical protein
LRCSEEGLFLGAVPLLRRSPRSGGSASWTARPFDELNRDLSDLYGLPVDGGARGDGLANVAAALDRGDLALAKIGALLLRLPDPPSVLKGAPRRGAHELAIRLFDSDLLKGGYDPAKHPRTGEPPNHGWYANTKKELQPSEQGGANEDDPNSEEPKRLAPLRSLLKTLATLIIEQANLLSWTTAVIKDSLELEVMILELSAELNPMRREMRQKAIAKASLDPPKTLQELLNGPKGDVSGYEQHHIVEQNPANVLKSPIAIWLEKFGRNLIDSPSNIVWVPRLKHELITAYYNSKEDGDPRGRLHRQVINEMPFDQQRQAGLDALKRFGVLQ